MAENVAVNEQQLHHFLSVSNWNAKQVMSQVARETENTLGHLGKGLLLDETSWLKKGRKSVGVSKQYLGSAGKIDNGQVVVFAALVQADKIALVNADLYLPQQWTADCQRLQQAGVPTSRWVYQSKADLALQIIQEVEGQIRYDWIGGDSIYGNSRSLREGLTQQGKRFVLDTSLRQQVYLHHPAPYIPDSKAGAGRRKSSYVSDQTPVTVEALPGCLLENQWQSIRYRQGTKGWLVRKAAVVEVFLWSSQRPTTQQVEH